LFWEGRKEGREEGRKEGRSGRMRRRRMMRRGRDSCQWQRWKRPPSQREETQWRWPGLALDFPHITSKFQYAISMQKEMMAWMMPRVRMMYSM
jgi:hypothetical protein